MKKSAKEGDVHRLFTFIASVINMYWSFEQNSINDMFHEFKIKQ